LTDLQIVNNGSRGLNPGYCYCLHRSLRSLPACRQAFGRDDRRERIPTSVNYTDFYQLL